MDDTIVFVVADDAAFRHAAARALSQEPGMRAVSMGSASAVNLTRSGRPALVLVDLVASGAAGPALVRRLRECVETQDIPVVALARPDIGNVSIATEGVTIVRRPSAIGDLVGLIRQHLPGAPTSAAPIVTD